MNCPCWRALAAQGRISVMKYLLTLLSVFVLFACSCVVEALPDDPVRPDGAPPPACLLYTSPSPRD